MEKLTSMADGHIKTYPTMEAIKVYLLHKQNIKHPCRAHTDHGGSHCNHVKFIVVIFNDIIEAIIIKMNRKW